MKKRRWHTFIKKVVIAGVIAFFISIVPLPVWTPSWFLYWQVPAVIFLFICFVGKLLIDTIVYPPED